MPTAVGPGTVCPRSVNHVDMHFQWYRSRCAVLAVVTVLVICCCLAACGGSTGSSGVTASRRAVTKATIGSGGRVLPAAQDARPALRAAGTRVNNSAFRQTVTKFDGCLRRSGVTVSSSTADTSSARFEAAWAKCRRSVDLGRAHFYRPTAGKRANGRGP